MIATTDWMISSVNESNEITLSLTAIDGKRKSKTIPMSVTEFGTGYRIYREGALIQDAFPNLSIDDREFMLNGMDDLDIGEAS